MSIELNEHPNPASQNFEIIQQNGRQIGLVHKPSGNISLFSRRISEADQQSVEEAVRAKYPQGKTTFAPEVTTKPKRGAKKTAKK